MNKEAVVGKNGNQLANVSDINKRHKTICYSYLKLTNKHPRTACNE